MFQKVSLETKSLCATILVLAAVMVASLRKVDVDRLQENVYLGIPYCMLFSQTTRVGQSDPFAQNAAITVIPPAWIYLNVGKLSRVRLYFSLFTLLAFLLTHFLMKQTLKQIGLGNDKPKWPIIHLGMFVTWVSIPLLFSYSIQTNGMMPGLCAFLGALIVYPRSRWVAYVLFGLAAHFKGQFVGLSIGLALFVLTERYLASSRELGRALSARSFGASLKELLLFAGCFLSAPLLMTLFVYLPLGWIKSVSHFIEAAFLIPTIIVDEIRPVLLRLAGLEKTTVGITAAVIRQRQRDNFGNLDGLQRLLIVSSILFCLCAVGATITPWLKRFEKTPLRAVGFCGVLYWTNFLLFYAFPYWYNVLPILWFSILFFPIGILLLLPRLRFRFAEGVVAVSLVLIGLYTLPKHTNIFSPSSGSSIVNYPFKERACNDH